LAYEKMVTRGGSYCVREGSKEAFKGLSSVVGDGVQNFTEVLRVLDC